MINANIHRLSIAPMLDITNNHFRALARFITKETVLYTEMINHDTILYKENEILYDRSSNPVVLQLGGNNPELLAQAALKAKELGYTEINLNCGCPSSKVSKANFGACLMKSPKLVAECTNMIRKATGIETTVKCRLGLDKDNDVFLDEFINTVNTYGDVNHFIIHSRLAIMSLDAGKNRKIPPLKYERVYKLIEDFPDIKFSINGGIKTLDEVYDFLSKGIYGCMIGRAAYENLWLFSKADEQIYGRKYKPFSRKDVYYQYIDYCDQNKDVPSWELLKPLTYLFAGETKNNVYKQMLYDVKKKNFDLIDHLKSVIEEYEKINPDVVNKLNHDDM